MKILIICSAALSSILFGFSQTPKKAEVVSLDGSNVYYEVYGKGEPLFLLHGYTASTKIWLEFVSAYQKNFEVYLVDLKGHGKSGMFKETLSIKSAAVDLDKLIRYLKLDTIKAIGLSYGGDILFQLALLHPGLIKSMISIGACGSWNSKDYPDWIDNFSNKKIDSTNLKWIQSQQTSEAQCKAILDQFPNYHTSVSDEEMKSIKAKTLFILGDNDSSIPLSCISSARLNLPESYLWILPNTGHVAHVEKNKTEFIRISNDFFAGDFYK